MRESESSLVTERLAAWATHTGIDGTRRLSNRLGEVHHAATRVVALIEALSETRSEAESARTLRRLRGWLVDELATRASEVPELLDPVSSALYERLPDETDDDVSQN